MELRALLRLECGFSLFTFLAWVLARKEKQIVIGPSFFLVTHLDVLDRKMKLNKIY